MSGLRLARSVLGFGVLGLVGASCTAIVGSFDGPGGTGGGAPGTGGMGNSGGMTAGTMHTSSSSHTGTGAMTGTSTTATTTTTGTMSSVGGGGSAQGGGGSTSSSAGGGGGSVGACTDMSDEGVLQAPGFSIANVVSQCATDPNGVASCIASQAHLSVACSTCFADIFKCTFDHCSNECSGGASSGACFQCQSTNGCITALETCTGSYCKPGQTNACLGACTDVDTDPSNCGSCGKSCGTATTAQCSAGTCVCNGAPCSGACCNDLTGAAACVDTTHDNSNCGSCGNACTGGLTCTNGQCGGGNCASPNGSCDANIPCCTGTCGANGKCPSTCTPANGNCTVPSDCCSGVCQTGGICGCGDTTSDASNCGSCGHNCQGGACSNSRCQPFVVAQDPVRLQHPYGVASVFGQQVAWTDFSNPGSVTSCSVNGCGAQPDGVPFAMGLPSPYFITFEPVSKTAFWTEFGNGTVMKAAYTGSGSAWGPPTIFASGFAGPTGIAFQGNQIFWVSQMDGRIFTAPATGGPTMTVAFNQNNPSCIAVDQMAVYWTNTNGNAVMSCRGLNCGNNPINLTMNLPPGLVAGPFGIGADGVNVYWSNQRSGTIMACSSSAGCGSGPQTLAGGQLNPGNLTVDSQAVYWTNEGDGTVMQCNLPSCNGVPLKLAFGQNSPRGIAVDANSIYWANFNDGTVMKLAR